jgi:hypothetical protein
MADDDLIEDGGDLEELDLEEDEPGDIDADLEEDDLLEDADDLDEVTEAILPDVDEVDGETDDEVDADAPAPVKAKRDEDGDGEDDDDEEADPDDVEADLDAILKDRIAAAEEEEDDEEDETPEPEERGDATGRILPKRPGEFVCQSCFLVKHPSQLADEKHLLCADCV